MEESDIDAAVRLIGRAMNTDEGLQALETFRFHFACKRHGIDDGRRYYVLVESRAVEGIVGLHHYVWGPAENVWLAWFAVDPDCRGRGVGTLLLDGATENARRLGYWKVFIETYSTPEFADARAFYRAKGFVRAGRVQSYLANGGDMVVFYKDLTNNA